MGIYKILDSINNKNLFTYILIIIFSIFFFKNRIIGLNIFLGLIFAAIAIAYLYDRKLDTIEHEDERYEKKLNTIRPEPYGFKDRKDIIDLLFTIQDIYPYNPPAYDELINNLTSFFTIRTDMINGVLNNSHYYQIAESKKLNSLNALHSMIFNLPDDKGLLDKFNRSHKRLDTLLTNYMNELYNITNDDIIKNGLNRGTQLINLGPKARNHYFDTDINYQFY